MQVESERVQRLNDSQIGQGDYVVYWMQSSQRVEYNHSLNYAIEKANKLRQPLLVAFGLIEYPETNIRHYKFMMEGLIHVQGKLLDMGAGLVFRRGDPAEICAEHSGRASLMVLDRGYLRKNREWYRELLGGVSCPVVQVESNVVVPVETASEKEEYSAATLRRRLEGKVDRFLREVETTELTKTWKGVHALFSLDDIYTLDVDASPSTSDYTGGYDQADRLLDAFVAEKLDGYGEKRNDPTLDFCSHMSPYLHFGQISPVEIALRVRETGSDSVKAFLEELVVRRELAINFVHYNRFYDSIMCLPDWCRKTLDDHRADPRQYNYTLAELENAETHDPYWNAAQTEMRGTGKMHGYMRMYWGKKILEWTESPEDAYRAALHLNNKYELDGRDPNGYAGVAWCFGKHDRPWKERPIFGKVRYMNDRGLERKFKIREYADRFLNK